MASIIPNSPNFHRPQIRYRTRDPTMYALVRPCDSVTSSVVCRCHCYLVLNLADATSDLTPYSIQEPYHQPSHVSGDRLTSPLQSSCLVHPLTHQHRNIFIYATSPDNQQAHLLPEHANLPSPAHPFYTPDSEPTRPHSAALSPLQRNTPTQSPSHQPLISTYHEAGAIHTVQTTKCVHGMNTVSALSL